MIFHNFVASPMVCEFFCQVTLGSWHTRMGLWSFKTICLPDVLRVAGPFRYMVSRCAFLLGCLQSSSYLKYRLLTVSVFNLLMLLQFPYPWPNIR